MSAAGRAFLLERRNPGGDLGAPRFVAAQRSLGGKPLRSFDRLDRKDGPAGCVARGAQAPSGKLDLELLGLKSLRTGNDQPAGLAPDQWLGRKRDRQPAAFRSIERRGACSQATLRLGDHLNRLDVRRDVDRDFDPAAFVRLDRAKACTGHLDAHLRARLGVDYEGGVPYQRNSRQRHLRRGTALLKRASARGRRTATETDAPLPSRTEEGWNEICSSPAKAPVEQSSSTVSRACRINSLGRR